MNTSAKVDELIKTLNAQSMTQQERIIKIGEACLGWSYVWGGYGQYCTSSNRQSYANRSTCPSGESAEIIRKCQKLNGKASCSGCKYYPGAVTRFFDCRGFTRWTLQQIGISLQGAGATSQWNTEANWGQKGEIKDLPETVCCIFIKKDNTMSHTGFYIGNGMVIHCSGEVKKEKLSKKWTHWAIPVGLSGDVPLPVRPTLRNGSKGEYVTLAQTRLLMLGYDLGKWGADGKFGAKTEEAVKAFQKDHGINPDGVIGQTTWNALDGDPAKEVYYNVMIPHLRKSEADGIAAKYKDATVEAE